MKALRIGIVGCGTISHLHAECLQKLAAEGLAELVAGAEVDTQRGRDWSRKWNVPVFESLTKMLAEAKVDVVTVATPSGMHGDAIVEIAKAGKHILCEKPLDVLLSKADEAIAAAEKAGVILGGVFQQRFSPGPRKVKRAIDQGFFGKIVFVHCETPWYRSQAYYDTAEWRGTWALDGGVLGNQSPHMIDRLLWLGGDIAEVTSADLKCGYERDIEAETVAVATVRLKNGALGTITGTTLAYDGLSQRVLICGTEGSAGFSGDELIHMKTMRPFEEGDAAATDAASSSARKASGGSSDPMSIGGDGHLGNIRDYVLAVQAGRQPFVTAQESRKMVRALNLIYEKARVGRWAVKA
jgi:UDP-N-acetyl-2-amino-2-deoxyglucuronate dehydrogenase